MLSPEENEELLGHLAEYERIKTLFLSGKLHSGLLISGAKGVGKATLAYKITRFILSGGKEITKEDALFKQIANKIHPCLKVIEKSLTEEEKKEKISLIKKGVELNAQEEKNRKRSSVIKVEEIRQVLDFLSKTSADGNYRIVIIDTADDLNASSANSLLKILEEPPKKSLIILLANNYSNILPTIRSRTINIKLSPLSNGETLDFLNKNIKSSNIKDLELCASLSSGSIGSALSIYDYNGFVLYNDLLLLLSKRNKNKIIEISETFSKSDELLSIFMLITQIFIGRFAKFNFSKMTALENETEAFSLMSDIIRVDLALKVYENALSGFREVMGLNLDKKQFIINILESLINPKV